MKQPCIINIPAAWSCTALACLCATALAAPPGLGLPDMPPEKPGPTAAELDAKKRASQQAVQQAERRAAEQRAAAQREADQAKADKAAAEARAKKEQQAREAAEAKTRELERKLAAAEASAKAASEGRVQAKEQDRDDAPKQANKAVAPPPPATIPDFTRLPSVAGGPVFIALPLGSFEMGSTNGDPDEKPPHPVRVSQRIAMSEMEVTTAQYMACANDTRQGKPACDQPKWNEMGNEYNLKTGSNKYYQKFVANHLPIVGVSWHNARQYAAWLTSQTGHSHRLPTEAEWEFACRAGGNHTHCGSNDVNAVAWYGLKHGYQTHKGGGKAKNAWGLYDMSGNVWEWVADCYNSDEYQRRKGQGADWPAHQTSEEKASCSRVLRGGSWVSGASYVRSADRVSYTPDYPISYIGFRLARTLP